MAFLHADQVLVHLIGDYVLQSDWMAREKTKSDLAAAVHAAVYTLPFLFLTTNPTTLALICASHFVIDRWSLARYVVWLRNLISPCPPAWADCQGSGSPAEVPPWLATWLLVAVDNTMHLIINASLLWR